MSLLSIAPRLITLEGGEGVGKTSAIKVLREELERAGNEVITTREPGGTPLGEMLRGIICGSLIDHEISPQAELLMVFAARAQHLAEVITPALQRGAVVLCDRFTDSSYAYQGAGRGIPEPYIDVLDQAFVGVTPGMTILLDAPVAVGRQRAAHRGMAVDRIEAEQDDFFDRVRSGFLDRAVADPERFRVVDAARGRAVVEADLKAAVHHWLNKNSMQEITS